MAITQVGAIVTASGNSNAATFAMTLPAHQAGDVVYIIGGHPIVANDAGVAAGQGYSELLDTTRTGCRFTVSRKVATGNDQNVNCIGSLTATTGTVYVGIVLRGVDNTNPEDVTVVSANGSSTNPDPPAATPVTAGVTVLACAGSGNTDAAPGTITGYNTPGGINVNTTTDYSAYLAKRTADIAQHGAAENPAAFSAWATGAWIAATIVVRPAQIAATTGYRGRLLDGTDKTQGQTWTFANVDIGFAHPKRQVVVMTSAPLAAVQTATLGGQAMTAVVNANARYAFTIDTDAAGITGTRADLVITQGSAATATGCLVCVYVVDGEPTPLDSGSDQQTGTTACVVSNIAVENGGFVIYGGGSSANAITHTTTWNGSGTLAEKEDLSFEAATSYHTGQIPVTATSTTPDVTATPSGTSGRQLLVVSFGPPLSDVSNDLDVRYNMSAFIANNADLRWNMSAYVANNADLRWNMSSYVINSAELQWDIEEPEETPVFNDLELQSDIIAYVANEAELQWNMSAYIANSADLRWNMSAYILNSVDLRWNMSAYVDNEAELQWNMSAYVANDGELQWNMVAFIANNADLRYDIRNWVENDADLRYNIISYVMNDADLRWDMSAYVLNDAEFQWDMTAYVANDAELQWSMTAFVAGSLTASWNIDLDTFSVSNDLDSRWDINEWVSNDVDLRWNISAYVAGSVDLRYNMLAFVANDADLRFNISAYVSNPVDARWDMSAFVVGPVTLRWRIGEHEADPEAIIIDVASIINTVNTVSTRVTAGTTTAALQSDVVNGRMTANTTSSRIAINSVGGN